MSEPQDHPGDDLVSRAVAATRQLPIPDGPSAAVASRTLDAIGEAALRPKSRFLQRIYRMPWKSKAAALLGIAATALVVYVAMTSFTSGSIAFAQVVEKLTSAQSVSFQITIEPLQGTYPVMKTQAYFFGTDKMRAETHIPKADQTVVLVSDQAAGKTLLLNTAAKVAIVGTIKGGDQLPQETIAARFRKLSNKALRSLGQKLIDGVEASGFEVEKDGGTMQIWADSKTGNPVRMEGEYPLPQPIGKSKMVINNFKLDEKLDPAMFSVEPPKDYTVIKSPIDIDLSVTPAQLVTTILRMYAERVDGQFPARLNDQGESIFAELKKRGVKLNEEGEDVEITRLRGWIMQLNMILVAMKAGKDYEYYPGGKLGEKDRIVFWYKDAKSGEYQAIYGDLQVKKIDKEQLPPALEDAKK